jgi:hypothetical protein
VEAATIRQPVPDAGPLAFEIFDDLAEGGASRLDRRRKRQAEAAMTCERNMTFRSWGAFEANTIAGRPLGLRLEFLPHFPEGVWASFRVGDDPDGAPVIGVRTSHSLTTYLRGAFSVYVRQ